MRFGVLSAEHLPRSGAGGASGNVTLVDARTRSQFERGHIPGAIHMDWDLWCAPPPRVDSPFRQRGYWGLLAEDDPAAIGQRLATCGLRRDSPIVVYADGVSSRGREARIAWMLLYYGASEVFLLEGGWRGWGKVGGAQETGTSQPSPGQFTVELQRHRRRTLAELRTAYSAGALPRMVDTRSWEEFSGELPTYLSRRGHLPDAVLIPFSELFDRHDRYIRQDRYVARLCQQLGRGTELVAYCEVGVRACLFALLHELYTGEIVPVFDGSAVQWAFERVLPLRSSVPERCKTG